MARKLVDRRLITRIDLPYLQNFVCAWTDYNSRLRAAKNAPPGQRQTWIRLTASGRRIARTYASGLCLIPRARVALGPVDRDGEDVELARIFRRGAPLRLSEPARRALSQGGRP